MSCCQQYELYAAESEGDRGRQFRSLAEIQSFVDALRDTWWWQRWYPKVLRVEVGKPASKKASVGAWFPENNTGKIEMLEVHWCEQYVLHELAHVLADYRFKSQAHCPWFARVYMELVHNVQGSAAFVQLHGAFDRHNIKHDPDHYDEDDLFRAKPLPPVGAHDAS